LSISAAVLLLMMTWGRLKRLRLYSRKAMVRKGRGAVRMAGPGDFLIPNKAIMMIWKNIMAVMMCWKICIHNCTTTRSTISLVYVYGSELGTTNSTQL